MAEKRCFLREQLEIVKSSHLHKMDGLNSLGIMISAFQTNKHYLLPTRDKGEILKLFTI